MAFYAQTTPTDSSNIRLLRVFLPRLEHYSPPARFFGLSINDVLQYSGYRFAIFTHVTLQMSFFLTKITTLWYLEWKQSSKALLCDCHNFLLGGRLGCNYDFFEALD